MTHDFRDGRGKPPSTIPKPSHWSDAVEQDPFLSKAYDVAASLAIKGKADAETRMFARAVETSATEYRHLIARRYQLEAELRRVELDAAEAEEDLSTALAHFEEQKQ